MATADQYAEWIVNNADKRGTPEFDTVAQAYQMAKQEESRTAIAPPPEPKEGFGQSLVRGFKAYVPQLQESVGGLGVLAGKGIQEAFGPGDVSAGLMKSGLERMKAADEQQKSTQRTGEGSFTKALDMGVGTVLSEWLPYQVGSGAANLLESLALMGAGALAGTATAPGVGTIAGGVTAAVGKELAKKGVLEAAKKIAVAEGEEVAKKFVEKAALDAAKDVAIRRGQTAFLAGQAAGYGFGQVTSRAVQEAQERGEAPDSIELTRVLPAGLVSTAAEFLSDKIGLGALKGLKKESQEAAKDVAAGLLTKSLQKVGDISKGILVTGTKEAPTEIIQQAAERFGAKLNLTDAQALREYMDAAAAAYAMSVVPGGIGGLRQREEVQVSPTEEVAPEPTKTEAEAPSPVIGEAETVRPEEVKPLTMQEQQELARRRLSRLQRPTAEDLLGEVRGKIQTASPTAPADIARIRDDHETAVINSLLEQDKKMQSVSDLARLNLERMSQTESMQAATQDADRRVREARLMGRVQSLIDQNIPFASTAIADINRKFDLIGEAPLNEGERARVQNIMTMAQGFTDFVKLPSLPVREQDRFAENQAMEALIKERKPRGEVSPQPIRAEAPAPSPVVGEAPVSTRVEEGRAIRPEAGVEPSIAEDRQRAEPIGQQAEVTLYRGVPENAEERKTVGGAKFMSPNKTVAENYAGASGNVSEESYRFNNLLDVPKWTDAKTSLDLPRSASMEDIVNAARDAGFDGVSFNTTNGKEYIVISAEPVAKAAAETTKPIAQSETKRGAATRIIAGEEKIPAQWEVVEADSVKAAMTEGKAQPRDRQRAVSNAQIMSIAQNPDFDRLSDTSQTMDYGAPTLTQEGEIVGGNGRFEGVNLSYDTEAGQRYKQSLVENAERLGINPEQVGAMKKPILVRRITQPADTRKLAIQSNIVAGLELSDMEQAALDAERMAGLDRLEITEAGDIPITSQNMDVLRSAFKDYTTEEMGKMMSAEGGLSQAGLRRVRNAILYNAYGKTDTLARLVESPDPDLKNVGTALMRSSGIMSQMMDAIRSGAISAEYNIIEDLTGAIETLSFLRASGTKVQEFLAQTDMFGDGISGPARAILRFMDNNLRSAKSITEFLNDYAKAVLSAESATEGLFGEVKLPTKQETVERAAQKYEAQRAAAKAQRTLEEQPAGEVRPESRIQPEGEGRAAVSDEEAGKVAERPKKQSETSGSGKPRVMDYEGRPADKKPIFPGDVFETSSGRTTTPYPKQKSLKYSTQWLIDNAVAEAKARGDEFNARIFAKEKLGRQGVLPDASQSSLLEYLFGQQPDVIRSVLKPLKLETKKSLRATPEQQANDAGTPSNITEAMDEHAFGKQVGAEPFTESKVKGQKAYFTSGMRQAPNKELGQAIKEESTSGVIEQLSSSNNPIISAIGKLAEKRPWFGVGMMSYFPDIKPPKEAKGFFATDSRLVLMRNKTTAESEHVVAHEVTHFLTWSAINNPTEAQKPAIQRLKQLFDHVKKNISNDGQKLYGLTSLDEFIAEANSNVNFQYKLRQIKYQNQTAWGAFTKYVAQLLGLGNDTALTEIIALTEELASTESRTTVASPGVVLAMRPDEKTYRGEVGKEPLPTPTTAGQSALDTINQLGMGVTEPEPNKLEKIRKRLNQLGEAPVKDTAKEWKKSASEFASKIDSKIFSADAVFENKLREGFREDLKDINDFIGAMLNVSQSQAVGADAVSTRAMLIGKVEYQKDLHKWVAVDDDANEINKAKILDEISKKYGLTKEEAVRVAHTYLVAANYEGILERNASLAERIEELKAEDKDNSEEIKRLKNAEVFVSEDQEAMVEPGLAIAENIPEVKQLTELWNKQRQNVKNVMVETGLWTPEYADAMMDNAAYVPFYREMEEEADANPDMMIRGLQVKAKEHKLKGSKAAVNDVFENMARWQQYAINRAIRNHKALQMIDAAKDMQVGDNPMATKVSDASRGKNVVRVWRDGKQEFYSMADPLFMDAFKSLGAVSIPSIKYFTKIANVLRESIVLYPLFSVGQVPQDAVAAMFASGLEPKFALKIPFMAVREFIKTLNGSSKIHEELRDFGVVGVRDFNASVARQDAEITAGIKAPPGVTGKIKYVLERIAMSADNAVRQAVYEASMDAGLSKAEALEKAFEVINFRRRGSSKMVNLIGQTVPFFYAYLSAQRVAYKTITGVGISPTERKAALETLAYTSAAVMALSFMYAMANGDDEDYRRTPATIRDRSIIIPGTNGVRIPLRPDFFLFPKIIAEHTYHLIADNGFTDPPKFMKAMRDNFANSAFAPNVVPQIVKPAVEIGINYDFFQGKPIVGFFEQNKEAGRQFTDSTSEFGKMMGGAGLSPQKVDHFVRGYFGTVGGLFLYGTNLFISGESGVPRPELSWHDTVATIPGVGPFKQKSTENALKNEFYELRDEVEKAKNTYDDIKRRSPEGLSSFIEDEKNYSKLAMEKKVTKIADNLSKIRRAIQQISAAPEGRFSSSEKQERIKELRDVEMQMLKAVDVRRLREMAKM